MSSQWRFPRRVAVLLAAVTALVTASESIMLEKAHGAVPAVFAHGSHFEVGWTIGATFAEATALRVQSSGAVQRLKKWILTKEGAQAYGAMLEAANATYPQYVQEMEGIAYGSGVDFESIFIVNCRNELEVLAGVYSNRSLRRHHAHRSPSIEHCSDYLLHADDGKLFIAHNEDGGKSARNTAFFVTAHIYGEGVMEELWFTGYTYPGELPSNAFFFNQYGVGASMNGLYPTNALYGGIGRNFISRHLLGAKNMEDAIARLLVPNQGTGHSYNVWSRSEHRLVNLEVAPAKGTYDPVIYSLKEVELGQSLFHANIYQRLDIEQIPEKMTSSFHREARAEALPEPKDPAGLLLVLGDAVDVEYPIYRTATAPDTGYTLCTALIDLERNLMTVYVKNPHSEPHARYTVPMEMIVE